VLFKSHAVNRARGAFSVFLPTVRDLRDTSAGIKRQLELATATQRFTFVIWGIPKVIAAIEDARARLDPAAVSRLAESATAHSARLGEGLQTAAGLEAVNRFLTGFTHPGTGAAPAEPGALAQAGLSGAGRQHRDGSERGNPAGGGRCAGGLAPDTGGEWRLWAYGSAVKGLTRPFCHWSGTHPGAAARTPAQ
jgi:hypothetical protein